MRVSFTVPEGILHSLLDDVPLPDMATVRYDLPTPPDLIDVEAALVQGMRTPGTLDRVRPGDRIALAVGSRGIDRLAEVVAALVRQLRAAGAEPFIVPSMGSHGGATAEGQREVLAHLGVTPERVGAPIEADMRTVVVGTTERDHPVHLSQAALQADGIVIVARIKPHTAFRGPYESGLAKMIAIGLGKQVGAATTHAYGFGQMAHMVPAMARVALQHAPLLFAVGILENAHDRIFKLVVLPAGAILAEEPALLEEARAAMPRLPVEQLDVLVIDEIGKNLSGDGADPNVTGRFPTPDASGGPLVTKQVVLDLTIASDGNANGAGTADFTTLRLARKFDWAQTYPNALTSTIAGPVKLPMVLPSDRLALAAAVLTCNAVDRPPRLLRLRNTLQVSEFQVSAALLPELEALAAITALRAPAAPIFDASGNFPDLPPIPDER